MPYLQKNTNPTVLVHDKNRPALSSTVAFRRVIDTLPDQCPVPASVIKLGLLAQHLEPKPDNYEINTEHFDIESTSNTIVPPQTLGQIRWLLSNHTSHLTDYEKDQIGDLCSASGLNRPPKTGTSNIEAIQSDSQTTIDESLFVETPSDTVECEFCGNEYESLPALNGHLANCEEKRRQDRDQNTSDEEEYTCEHCGESFDKKDALRVHRKRNCDEKESSESTSKKRPSFGKEIRKDRGSERVSGRNPFADTEKLKDTGLHQGGN